MELIKEKNRWGDFSCAFSQSWIHHKIFRKEFFYWNGSKIMWTRRYEIKGRFITRNFFLLSFIAIRECDTSIKPGINTGTLPFCAFFSKLIAKQNFKIFHFLPLSLKQTCCNVFPCYEIVVLQLMFDGYASYVRGYIRH